MFPYEPAQRFSFPLSIQKRSLDQLGVVKYSTPTGLTYQPNKGNILTLVLLNISTSLTTTPPIGLLVLAFS